ncbi:hypothetical protein BOTBODRAFT_193310 [Botryobasidium botryosum FD-172 SS1]|uniref:Uncharacterized protein n=1 Tax=Botryobasidium botryosum (strain FD-172 SS1) TaxID=930990 RepID=A0A067M210_BOTB1|nr:hypothetical protein BOTBODRAFT_193310 [Botryobasidium botryosum FD-172 SS1]
MAPHLRMRTRLILDDDDEYDGDTNNGEANGEANGETNGEANDNANDDFTEEALEAALHARQASEREPSPPYFPHIPPEFIDIDDEAHYPTRRPETCGIAWEKGEQHYGSHLVNFPHWRILLGWVLAVILTKETYGGICYDGESEANGHPDVYPRTWNSESHGWNRYDESYVSVFVAQRRQEWQAEYSPLALLSGPRGTAFQAGWVGSIMRSYLDDHPAEPSVLEASPILQTLADWAAVLCVTALARRGAWEYPLAKELQQFAAFGIDKYVDIPNPFDPLSTDFQSLSMHPTDMDPRSFRHLNFASFQVFAHKLAKALPHLAIGACNVPEPSHAALLATPPSVSTPDISSPCTPAPSDDDSAEDNENDSDGIIQPVKSRQSKVKSHLHRTTSVGTHAQKPRRRNEPSVSTRIGAGSRRHVTLSRMARDTQEWADRNAKAKQVNLEKREQADARREKRNTKVTLSRADLFEDA